MVKQLKNLKISRFPWRVFSRVFLIQTFLVISALGIAGLAGRYFFKEVFISQVTLQLKSTMTSLSRDLPSQGVIKSLASGTSDWCHAHAQGTDLRLTVMTDEGVVLCDSHHAISTMENHGLRPEVIEAKKSGYGSSVRLSRTIQENLLYGAMSLLDRHLILRGSIPLAELSNALRVFDTSFSFILFMAALAFSGASIWWARALVFPIGRLLVSTQSTSGNTNPRASDSFGEWVDLESSIEKIKKDLHLKSESLSREREELSTLMGAISDAILATDLEGVPLFFNSRFALLFGNEEGLQKRTIRLWEIFRAPEVLDAFKTAIHEGKSSSVKAVQFEQRDGTKRFFSLSVSALRKEAGDIYGAVGVFHDVTELKSAEQIRIDFVANVSHELRTPLTSIKGYADTLVEDVKQGLPVQKEFLDTILRNVGRLINLINDLLDLSSIESTDVLQKTSLSTKEITSRVAAQLKQNLDTKNQTIAIDVKAIAVYADGRRLEQVLVNLLDNASKYTPSGGKISITWVTEGRDIVLKVSDNGPGIPIEHHGRLFERFFRVDKARSREQGGTGLGLAIAKHIMQRHDGSITVESQMGRGSTFICRFPS